MFYQLVEKYQLASLDLCGMLCWNLQFWNGEMYFVTRDGKTSSTSRKDSCAPSFPPSQVSSILLELLGGGL